MYRTVVGEGGCDPRYFLREMGALEAQDYIEGVARRQRAGWEQAREMMRVTAAVGGSKRFDFPLPWDKEDGPRDEADPAELERLRARARAMEKRMKNRTETDGTDDRT